MEKKPFLLFDFDGVIIDSIGMINRHVLTHWGDDEEAQKRQCEGNAHARKDGEVPVHVDLQADTVTAAFLRDYEKDMPSCNLFPGMRDTLLALKERYRFAIVSSSPGDFIRSYLDACGLTDLFEGIYGMDVAVSKSVKINTIVEREQAPLSQFLMITDTLGDIREARHAGVESIGVTWGLHERERLEKGGPWGICEIPAELPNAIDAYFASV